MPPSTAAGLARAAGVRESSDPARRDDPRYARLIATTREAARAGYDAVSMRDIAAAARVSLTTVYQLFESKDQLIAEAHADRMEGFRAQLSRRPPRGRTAAARVRAVVRGMVNALERDDVRTRTLMRALYSLEPSVDSSRLSVRDTYVAMIDAAIGDEAIEPRAAVIDTLGHVVNSAMLQWLRGDLDAPNVGRVLDQAVSVLLGDSVRV